VDWQQHWSAKSAEQRSFSFIEGPVIAVFCFEGCYDSEFCEKVFGVPSEIGRLIMGFRIFSGAVLAFVVFFAMRATGMETGAALAVSMVPLISAAINVMTGPIFSLSAIAGLVFIIVPLLPVSNWFGADVVAAIRNYTGQVKSLAVEQGAPAPSPAMLLARRLADIEAACTSGVLTPSACEEAKRQAIQNMSQALGIGETAAPRPAN
jgi:hypothetical protein